jgi:hypothetical protein
MKAIGTGPLARRAGQDSDRARSAPSAGDHDAFVEVGVAGADAVLEAELVVECNSNDLAVAMACSSAAILAPSAVPVGSAPSLVWNDFSASVKAGVHLQSNGPVQNPASLSVCCSTAVEAVACWAAAPPLVCRSVCKAAPESLSTVPVTGGRGPLQGRDRVDRGGSVHAVDLALVVACAGEGLLQCQGVVAHRWLRPSSADRRSRIRHRRARDGVLTLGQILARVFHVADRRRGLVEDLAVHQRQRTLDLSAHAPWSQLLAKMIDTLQGLPTPG